MPTRLTVKNRKFFRELENGSGFSLNPTSFGTHLKGSVGDKVKMTCNAEVYYYIELKTYNYNNGGFNDHSITFKGGFVNASIWIGDGISIRSGAGLMNATITSVSDDFISFNNITGNVPPSGDNSGTDRLKLNRFSTDLRYSYNVQEQLESFDLKSLINGSESSFIVKEISSLGGFSDGEWSNKNTSLKDGAFRCSYIGDSLDDDPRGNDPFVFRYEIEHEFTITPYWLEGWDLEGQPNEIFQDSNTLRYVANYGFRRGYNNPNTEVNGIDDNGLGSVGAIGQTFNDFTNRYFISDYSLTDMAGFGLSGVNVAESNKINFTVTNDKIGEGFINRLHSFVATVSKTPDFDDYNYSDSNDFDTIWGFGTSRGSLVGGTQSLIGFFSSASINIIDDQTVEVELILSFPNDYINRTENDDKYALFFEIGDTTLEIDDSDSVNLLLEQNQFSKDINIQGLVVNNAFQVKRTSDESITGFTDYKGWIQHGVNVTNNFSMNVDDNALIDSLSVGIIAKKGNEFFDVYRYNLDLSTIINDNGTQNIVIDSSQNYKLIEGSIFNEIKLRNTGQSVTGFEDYELSYGLKIPYQDWQSLPNAPNEFYDVSKELNGLNKNASNYIANGYTLHLFTDVNATQFSIPTLYRNLTDPIQVLNFDDDGNDPKQWVGTIQTFNLNGNDLGGSVLVDEPTRILATFTAPTPLSTPFGVIRIGEERHGGNAVDELTNATLYPEDNRLIPLDGESELKVLQVGNIITLEAMTNIEQLENVNYTICAEVFDADTVVSLGAFSSGFNNGFDI